MHALGLIILNAHRVTDSSGEGFAVRLYRQGSGIGLNPGQGSSRGNSSGFVRAFSDNPNAFAAGFNRCGVCYGQQADSVGFSALRVGMNF